MMVKEQIERIGCPSSNYYGGPAVWERNGKFYLGTENYTGWDEHETRWDEHEISKEFYDAWVMEFAAPNPAAPTTADGSRRE